MKLRSLLLPLLVAPLLAGCEIEPAAYLIDGGNHSLTVERKKAYFWSTGWELDPVEIDPHLFAGFFQGIAALTVGIAVSSNSRKSRTSPVNTLDHSVPRTAN